MYIPQTIFYSMHVVQMYPLYVVVYYIKCTCTYSMPVFWYTHLLFSFFLSFTCSWQFNARTIHDRCAFSVCERARCRYTAMYMHCTLVKELDFQVLFVDRIHNKNFGLAKMHLLLPYIGWAISLKITSTICVHSIFVHESSVQVFE